MASDIEELRRRQSEKETELREQKRYEKERKKAQKGIVKANRKSMRSKARAAAKDVYPSDITTEMLDESWEDFGDIEGHCRTLSLCPRTFHIPCDGQGGFRIQSLAQIP